MASAFPLLASGGRESLKIVVGTQSRRVEPKGELAGAYWKDRLYGQQQDIVERFRQIDFLLATVSSHAVLPWVVGESKGFRKYLQ